MAIKKGDRVKINYIGSLDDGTVFDSSDGKEPLEFEAGSGKLIKGFDETIIGMEKGQEKTIRLIPADAYGEHNGQLVKKIPRHALPPGDPKPGMMLVLKAPDGQQFPARITDVTDQEITLDLNHPLAGKVLNFTIKVIAVE